VQGATSKLRPFTTKLIGQSGARFSGEGSTHSGTGEVHNRGIPGKNDWVESKGARWGGISRDPVVWFHSSFMSDIRAAQGEWRVEPQRSGSLTRSIWLAKNRQATLSIFHWRESNWVATGYQRYCRNGRKSVGKLTRISTISQCCSNLRFVVSERWRCSASILKRKRLFE